MPKQARLDLIMGTAVSLDDVISLEGLQISHHSSYDIGFTNTIFLFWLQSYEKTFDLSLSNERFRGFRQLSCKPSPALSNTANLWPTLDFAESPGVNANNDGASHPHDD